MPHCSNIGLQLHQMFESKNVYLEIHELCVKIYLNKRSLRAPVSDLSQVISIGL